MYSRKYICSDENIYIRKGLPSSLSPAVGLEASHQFNLSYSLYTLLYVSPLIVLYIYIYIIYIYMVYPHWPDRHFGDGRKIDMYFS